MKRVWIVGATSHLAKAILFENLRHQRWELTLFARNVQGVERFLQSHSMRSLPTYPIEKLSSMAVDADAIVNCVGFGAPNKAAGAGMEILATAEWIDALILGLLDRNEGTKYINFSSGAVYGTELTGPVTAGMVSKIALSPMKETEFYRVAKIYQEAKHRARPNQAIVDIRLFSFFSPFIELSSGYLITDIIQALRKQAPLVTSPEDLIRDYLGGPDLFDLLCRIVDQPFLNCALDTYSRSPISKMDLLKSFQESFGLKVSYSSLSPASPTGAKPCYYSQNFQAGSLGFVPRYTSWETLRAGALSLGLVENE